MKKNTIAQKQGLKQILTRVFCVCAVCCILFIGALNSFAITTPSSTLQTSIDEVLVYLAKPEYADPLTRPPLYAAMEETIRGVFDFKEFSRRAVGKYWRHFSVEQKANLSEAFAELLAVTYLQNLDGYTGGKIDYIGELFSKKRDKAVVRTLVMLDDGKAVPVEYRMLFKNSIWVVYDVVIENMSLIKNYRSQFASLLQKGTPEDLIAKILERVHALEAEREE